MSTGHLKLGLSLATMDRRHQSLSHRFETLFSDWQIHLWDGFADSIFVARSAPIFNQ